MTPDQSTFLADKWPFILLVFLVITGAAAASERLAEIFGRAGKLLRWWQDGEVRKIEREAAEVKARREAIAAEAGVELLQLREDVAWLKRQHQDQIRRDRLRDKQARAVADWINEWVPKARAAGIDVPEPPDLFIDPLLEETPT